MVGEFAGFAARDEKAARRQLGINPRRDAAGLHEALVAGMNLFLDECAHDDFRRIVLEQAPAALGGARWKKIDEASQFRAHPAQPNGV